MSDDLLQRLDEWGTVKRLEYLPSLGREAAAALRELQAELAKRLTVDEARDGSEAIFHWHERAERAEAERDALRLSHSGEGTHRCTCNHYPHLPTCGESERILVLRAENDALRALLLDIRPYVYGIDNIKRIDAILGEPK